MKKITLYTTLLITILTLFAFKNNLIENSDENEVLIHLQHRFLSFYRTDVGNRILYPL